jgi:hypothetical protein
MPSGCTRPEAALLVGLALASAACTSGVDDRPMTIQYVTGTILAPTCGKADCHSAFAANRTDVFDNVADARRSLVDNGLVQFTSSQFDPANPQDANLIIWLTETDPFALGFGRMPLDGPMPNQNIEFLEHWIHAGAPGAQCNPSQPTACEDHDIVACNSDWSFGALQTTCPGTCALGSIGGMCQ